VERLLHTLSALKPFFLSQSKLAAVIKTYFGNSLNLFVAHSFFICMFQTKVGAVHREGTSMQTILHSVHTSTAERFASRFVTLQITNFMVKMLEDGYDKVSKIFIST
jgi:hypothetical protein